MSFNVAYDASHFHMFICIFDTFMLSNDNTFYCSLKEVSWNLLGNCYDLVYQFVQNWGGGGGSCKYSRFPIPIRRNRMMPDWDFSPAVLSDLSDQAISQGTFRAAIVGQISQSNGMPLLA